MPNAELTEVERAMQEMPHGWRGDEAPPEGPPIPGLGRESVEISVKYAKCEPPRAPYFEHLAARSNERAKRNL